MAAPDRPSPQTLSRWTPHEAEACYHVGAWGNGYFSVNDCGHAAVQPVGPGGPSIDLYAVTQALRAQGLAPPFVLRFPDLLHTRVRALNEAFREAMRAAGYEGTYRGVYPIKVNQLRPVIEEILEAGAPYGFGLECGSRAELVAALPYISGERLLVSNGCKDPALMRLLAGAQRLGQQALPVLERFTEFDMLRSASQSLPRNGQRSAPLCFGVRVRLSTSGAGLWSESSGEHSKFGLSLGELLWLADALEDDALHFCLLHFHLGSQITDLDSVRAAVEEAARIYAALHRRGLGLTHLDIGGGLGVPYEAGNPEAQGHINYTLASYTRAVVETLRAVCDAERVPHPTLVSESGRALTAYHALLVTAVLEVRAKTEADAFEALSTDGAASPLLRKLDSLHERLRTTEAPLPSERLRAAYRTNEALRAQTRAAFRQGRLSLEEKALASRRYWAVCHQLHAHGTSLEAARQPDELHALYRALADHYLCDFSLFRSVPDHWALGQRFPIMPLHRLDEKPTRRGILNDLTCDSDGAVRSFVTPHGTSDTLALHPPRPGEPYYLGLFLLGAYQDVMGDMHNLFGRPAEAVVRAAPEAPEGFTIESIRPGETVDEELTLVQYEARALEERLGALLRHRQAEGICTAAQAEAFRSAYAEALRDTTYLHPQAPIAS